MAHIISNVNYDEVFFDEFGHHAFPEMGAAKLNTIREAATARILFKEALVEQALANLSNGLYSRISGWADFDDDSDCKTAVSQRRQNCQRRGQWTHSIPFTKVQGKPGGLRLVGLDQYNNEWFYLAVPHNKFQHLSSPLELIIESYSGYYNSEPPWNSRIAKCKWNDYRVDSFEELARYKF